MVILLLQKYTSIWSTTMMQGQVRISVCTSLMLEQHGLVCSHNYVVALVGHVLFVLKYFFLQANILVFLNFPCPVHIRFRLTNKDFNVFGYHMNKKVLKSLPMSLVFFTFYSSRMVILPCFMSNHPFFPLTMLTSNAISRKFAKLCYLENDNYCTVNNSIAISRTLSKLF